jgi:diguanylate cyclase (GGDEF)-like protein/PAS domain S-box-containing protein
VLFGALGNAIQGRRVSVRLLQTPDPLRALLLLAGMIGGGLLGLSLPAIAGHIALLWLPSGIALAALRRWGLHYWPWVWLSSFLLHLWAGGGWLVGLGIGAGASLAALCGAYLLRDVRLEAEVVSARALWWFALAVAVGCSALSASLGIMVLWWGGPLQLAELPLAWLGWLLGDAAGVLLGGLPLLVASRSKLRWPQAWPRRLELSVALTLGLLLGLAHDLLGGLDPQLDLLPVLVVAWMALRFGLLHSAGLASLMAIVAALDLLHHQHSVGAAAQEAGQVLSQWTAAVANVAVAMVLAVLTASRELSLQALRQSERRFREQIELAAEAIVVLDVGAGHFIEANQRAQALFGLNRAQLLCSSPTSLSPPLQPDGRDSEQAARGYIEQALAGKPQSFVWEHLRRDGSAVSCEIWLSRLPDPERQLVRGLMTDIGARRDSERAERENERRWAQALEASGDGVWDWHIADGMEFLTPRLKAMYGYAEDELPNTPEALDSRTHPDDRIAMEAARQAHFDGQTPAYVNEHRVRCKDGSWKWVLSRGAVVSRDANGRPLRMVGTHTDITERKQTEELIWRQANFDPLTGLPNRRLFRERLQAEVERCEREGGALAVLFVDLDGFKEINDTLGHEKGDQLLIEAARRLRDELRVIDVAGRLGGDEFTVMMIDAPSREEVDALSARLLESINQAFLIDQQRCFVSASIGISLYPEDASSVGELFKHADQALYAAKDRGRNRTSYFSRDLEAATERRVRIARELRGALAAGQFHLHYQPIIDLRSGVLRKVEALIRWQHPELGAVSPAEFIPVAEQSGLIGEIGDWVFETALAQAKAWRCALHPEFQITLNVSPAQFRADSIYLQRWVDRLAQCGVPGRALVLEITEGLLLDASARPEERLVALRESGLQVSIDDFGTGFSSLSYLHRYAIDYVKIDQSFVSGLEKDPRALALCKAIIAMSHALGFQVVAEGVETRAQLALLEATGCDFAQGYLFDRPLPAEQLPDSLGRIEQQLWSHAAATGGELR